MKVTEHYYTERPSSPQRRGLIKTILRGQEFEFVSSSGVFSARKIDLGTRILIEAMELPPAGRLLDLGCGYGPIGIVAAKTEPGLEIWMTDINVRATRLAEENLLRNDVGNAQVRQGSLYEPVEDLTFKAIVSNPPISAGMRKAVEPIIEGSVEHLEPGGSLQMVAQWNKGGRSLAKMMERHLGGYEVLERKSGYRVLKAVRR